MANKKVLHLIGNAHLDPVWLWRWSEGYEAARATFISALDRMDEEPEFIFTSSQAAVYKWIEQGDPDLFERIAERVKEGRWRIVGGWWMQSDCNIPCGESFVRQGLYGQRFFMNKFGVMAEVGYNVDSFGHNLMLPQILKKSGMNAYVFMRPGPHENPNVPERLFWWESPDGSRVLTFKIPDSYTAWGEGLERSIRKNAVETEKYEQLMQFYGVGNHGGGPTKENLAKIAELRKDPSLPELRYSSPDIFFKEIISNANEYPIWKEDLQHHASGCYSAHSGIKKNNRMIESRLAAAEMLSEYACCNTGLAYPKANLTAAWEGVLFNQFHDILAGSSIVEAYEDAAHLHGMAFQYADEAITFATGAITSKMDTSGGAQPIVVFNSLAWARKDYCECELHDFGAKVHLEDDMGNEVPCQVMFPSAATEPGWRTRVIFPAQLPSAGYRLYRAYPTDSQCTGSLSVDLNHLENDRIRVEIDMDTGQPASIYDKFNEAELLAGPSVANVIEDKSDTWSHGVFYFKDVIGRFEGAELQVIEEGPVRAAIRSVSRYENSTLTQEFRLYNDSDYLECFCEVDWHEQHKMLKLAFNTNIESNDVAYEIPYGHIIRPANGEEEPGLSWIDISDGNCGLCIINNAKYSYDVTGSTVNLTVLRSPIYAHHDPNKPDNPNRRYLYMDQGVSNFIYRIVPHRDGWRSILPHKRAMALNAPPICTVPPRHEGCAPSSDSFINVDSNNVIISVVKHAEDDDGIIIRCFETDGIATQCQFSIPHFNLHWDASINPYEIKTFLVKGNNVLETDLIERIIGDGL